MIESFIPYLLALAMLYVIYSDVTRYIIPNWLVVGIMLLFVLWVFIAPAPVDWLMGLLMFGVLLTFGFGLFALGIIGAGDAKLLAALGLYMGWGMHGLGFIIHMALMGGLAAIIIVTLRRIVRYAPKKPKILTAKAPAPYGIAIAVAFLIALAQGHVMGMNGGLL